MENNKLDFILEDIKRHFGFLLENGYKVQNIQYFPERFEDWDVFLESSECIIEIYSEYGEIMVAILPVNFNEKVEISLKSMIFFLTQETKFIDDFEQGKEKQFSELANLLKEYLNKITPYFGNDFEKHKDILISAQRKYFHRLLRTKKQ